MRSSRAAHVRRTARATTAPGAILLLLAACGGSSGSGPGTTPGGGGAPPNELSVTVNGASCSAASYPNKPCVSLTLCAPGTSTCQTIDDVLLDTGSIGIRLFKQAIRIPLQPISTPSGTLAQCVQWGDNSSDWGPVATASVVLASEPAVEVPIQIIDSTFATAPASCGSPDTDPASAGFNGILGVGVFEQDCGSGCASDAANGVYYVCNGASCAGASAALSSQVTNPVARLPVDNNGIVVTFPAVPSGGTASITGQVLLGIGTRSNNIPGRATVLALDANGFFGAQFGGATYQSFLDTGSNGFFVPPSSSGLPVCAKPNDSWYCPQAPVTLSATNVDAPAGNTTSAVSFQIGNYLTLLASPNDVFVELGGPSSSQLGLDWGLPFHFGRTVYVGLETTRSSLGTGPYFAY